MLAIRRSVLSARGESVPAVRIDVGDFEAAIGEELGTA
jgi:hypothetical protein